MSAAVDLTGQRFGRLVVIGHAPRDGRDRPYWLCRCDCGATAEAAVSNLRGGRSWKCATACVLGQGLRPWPRDPRYRVAPDGTIVGPWGRVLTPRLNEAGYPTVSHYPGGKHCPIGVHIVVCETFHGPAPEGHEVAHEDGDPGNPRAGNLRWSTHADNMADKVRHGTAQQGEASANHKLTESEVLSIRAAAAAGESLRALASRHGVTRQNVAFIVRRETWRHLP